MRECANRCVIRGEVLASPLPKGEVGTHRRCDPGEGLRSERLPRPLTRIALTMLRSVRRNPTSPLRGEVKDNQPQFQIAPIGVRVQHGPKLPPL